MPFRFSLQPPRTLLELFERIRELLPQLEPVILTNVPVETATTTIAHGLSAVPRLVHPPIPHCLAMVCQDKPPDDKNIYLRASNKCVVDVRIDR